MDRTFQMITALAGPIGVALGAGAHGRRGRPTPDVFALTHVLILDGGTPLGGAVFLTGWACLA